MLLTGLGDKLEVIDLIQDRVLKSRKITLIIHGSQIQCLSVRGREIFIGFYQSNKITVYDVIDLNEIKSIILQGIQNGYWPYDMTAIADRIFVCVSDGKEGSNHRSLIFEEKNGRILSELTKPTDTVNWYPQGMTLSVTLNVIACAWSQTYVGKKKGIDVIVFYSLFSENNSSFLIVEVKFGINRIRISDRGDRMVTRDRVTQEVKTYDMAELFTYSHFKEKLASTLQTDDYTSLANFFNITKDQTDAILSSDTPSENLLLALEEKGVLQPYNIDKLTEAFHELKINPVCCQLAEFYQKTRAQSTSYDRFLATLSAHLTASLPADLCDYFNISDEKKNSITSSQDPGLSFLLALDEMGIIKLAEVGALEQPFTEMELVQAVAKIHEYQSTVEEAENLFQKKDELSEEDANENVCGTVAKQKCCMARTNINKESLKSICIHLVCTEKKDLFIQCLQKKIKSWYETMTPVPWKKSCRWRSTDLFVGGSLILTDTKPKGTFANVDVDVKITDIKMQYTEIFSHEKLESEIRIILEGDPGSGKTMLMSQLAYDWCLGKFKEIELLVLLPLKFVEQKTIVQAIKDFYFPEDERLTVKDIENFLLNTTISRYFLLDGLEEYNGRVTEGEQSEVTKIMSKVKYPTCKVVISSRSDYAQNLPKCPVLKIAKFSDTVRSSYIQKVFPDNPKTQIEVRKVIQDNPFILDLCSVPLLFVLVVHNIESMVKLRMGSFDRVAPFVKNMVETLCPVGTLIRKTKELTLGYGKSKETTLQELAYNGLCRGHQQLYWQKEFIESILSDSKEWIDSGVLVVEESSGVVPMMQRDQDLSGITDAKSKYLGATEETRHPAAVGSGAVARTTSASTLGTGSDKDYETTSEPVDSQSQSETIVTSGSTVKHVPLQVRFLHKIIQEWFAATFFAFTISRYRDESLLEKYVNEQLLLIDPSDLHFVLRFTVALYTPCCHLVIKYLLRSYRSEEGGIPEHIMDCAFLCFAEYDGESRHNMLEAVAEVCKWDIVIFPEHSRLLQQAKVRMLELASKCGILTRKLILSEVVVSASDGALEFTSGIMMLVLDTLEEIEIIDRNGILEEEDYTNVLKFIKNCALIKEARLNFPNEPPQVDEETLSHMGEDEKTVTWKIGSQKTQTLNTTNGIWMVGSETHSLTSKADEDIDSGWDEHTLLETKGTLSTRGGIIEIPNTGVRLYIPQGALQEGKDECTTICMKIIPPDFSDKATTDFSSNSSVIVELLPDNLTFQQPVELTLPHCLQLKEGEEYKATIFMSHHKEGTIPSWEEKADQPHHLTNTACTILLNSFCWVKYIIDGRIVDAKRIQVYAAGKRMSYSDKIYQTEVGFYPDVPGSGQILRSNQSLIVASKQSFLFYKEGSKPLKFLLLKVIPQEWKSQQVEENQKEIPFQCIALDEERSCSFVFLKTSQEPLIPMFIFRVLQGSRGVRLLDRPKVSESSLHAENSSVASVSTHSQEFLQEVFPGDKRKLFIWCLQKKIKTLHGTMTSVPSSESWRWRSTELFVGGSLIFTDSKTKRSLIGVDEQFKLNYKEIFTLERLKSQTRVILEGDPGSGKTMLVSQLAYDWSEGNISEIDILILLPLKIVENKTLVECLSEFYIPDEKHLSPSDIEGIITDEGSRCCFILDGVEEYNGTQNPSEVMKVMTKMKYTTCKVILTSRSDCAQDLPSCPVLKLELFGDTERNTYLKKVFPGNLEGQLEVKKFIEDNPSILDLCRVPVLFVLVVHNIETIKIKEIEHFDQVTPFMTNLVDILCSSVTSKSGVDDISLYNQMQGKTCLEEVAYNGLCRGHQQLSWQKDFVEKKVPNSKKWLDSGLLVVDDISNAVIHEMDQQQTSLTGVGSKTEAGDMAGYERKESIEGIEIPGLSGEAAGYSASAKRKSEMVTLSKTKKKSGVFSRALTYFKKLEIQDTRKKGQSTLQSRSAESTATKLQPESDLTDQSTEETDLKSKNVPRLQLKFLHKIIQEWFAAKHLSSILSNHQPLDLQHKYLSENLPLINPADLHYLLCFSCALHPPCCHVIINHLLQRYKSKEGDVPEHIMNCIFLCFAEYDGDIEPNILGAMLKLCKRDIIIHSEDSRFLQEAKISVTRLASNYGIVVQKLYLVDVVVSASKDVLTFSSGVRMEIIDTLRVLEIICCDQTLKEKEYPKILKFIAKCTLLEEAKLHFPFQPPAVDKVTLKQLEMEDKTVTWIIGPRQNQTLDTATGKWIFDNESQSSVSGPGSFSSHLLQGEAAFETIATITNSGGVFEIPNTGVRLDVPPDALEGGKDQCKIEMRIIPPSFSFVSPTDFTSNSSVIVELLPNDMKFQFPVQLRLPHCLQLKKGVKHKAKIFISHHEEGGKPHWEEQVNPRYILKETYCTVLLDSFCWVKFTIDGKIVEAKRIQVYAAGMDISLHDLNYGTEVGYYPDIPGGGEILRLNEKWVVAAKKPFLFYKEGEEPLKMLLQKIVPREWKHATPEENPMEIPFECVALSEERSCPFVFEKESKDPLVPVFIFRAIQGNRGVRLIDRPKVQEEEL